MSSRKRRFAASVAGFVMSLGLVGATAGAAHALQALPVTVTGSTNWSVANSLPPAGPATTFSFGTKPLVPVIGDWDGNGTRTPGTFEAGVFKLSNALPPGGPPITIPFGDPRGFPLAGDFDGDGRDDLAVYRNGLWQIRIESGGTGAGGAVTPLNVTAYAGSWPSTIPVAGDWDGNGTDGIGRFVPLTGDWVLRQTAAGVDLPAFTYNPGVGPYGIVGDWDNDGDDTIGVKAGTSWLLNNQNDSSPPDIAFPFGLSSDLPLVGGGTAPDTPPTAVDDAATVAEDASAAAVNVLANDTDPDGGPKLVFSVTQPANGTVVITGGGTGLTYQPNPNYCNSPPGTSLDTFAYTLNDAAGSTATVSMTVTCVDDPPVAVNDSATVAENSGANAVGVLANDTDVDGGPKSVFSVTQPANGTVAITGGGTGVSYTPNANYCNNPPGTSPDTFTYRLNDAGGSTATVSMTVTCVGDNPVVNTSAGSLAYTENDPATLIDAGVTVTDVDAGAMITGATVAITTNFAAGDTLALSGIHPGISAMLVANTLSLTGTATPAAYQAALRAVTYVNASENPSTALRTVTFTVTDNNALTGSDIRGITVAAVDDPPVAVADSATVAVNAAATAVPVLTNDTDVDGGPKFVFSVVQPANGTVVITGGGTGVSYTPNANYCNSPPGTSPDTFTYRLNNASGSTATVSMTVTCAVDTPPTAVNDAATVAEDANATAVPVLTNDTDPDGGPKFVFSVTQPANGTVVITGGGTGLTYAPNANYCNSPPGTTLDAFTYRLNDASGSVATVSMTVTCVDDPPVAVNNSATVNEDDPAATVLVLANDTDIDGGPKVIASATDPANGTVVLTGGSSGAHTGLNYQPDPNYCNSPSGTPDTFSYTLNGGSSATVSMTVTCVNDNPRVNTSAGSLPYTENDPAKVIDAGVTVTDPDAGAMITGATVAITSNYAGGQDVLALSGIHPGISAMLVGNTLSLTGTATPAAYQAALRAVTYVNTSEGPSTLTRTVTFTVTDNTALTGSGTRGIAVAAVNDPPTAVNDSGTTDEDTPLTVVAPGVLANDTDVDPGDTKTVVALNGSATLTGSTAEGGSVTINANGSYTYTPPAAFQAMSTGQSDTDSFTYTMRDAANAQSTATVNLTVNGVSDAPTAVADTFNAIGNTGLFVGTTRPATQAGKVMTGSVLTNDTDPDTPQANLVAEPVTNAPTSLGGTITIEADGNFTYHPDDVDTAVTDTFTYRVCDSSPCNAGTVANATGTLNLPIAGQIWYVRNNQAAGGDGTSDTPFDTLVEAETASQTGDTVYVFDGNNTTTNLNTGYLMEANERLIGESRPLSLDPDGGGSLPTSSLFPGTSGAQPTLTASNEDVIVLASNVLVDGVDVDPSGTGGGLSGTAGTSAVTVQNVNVTDTGTLGTQPGIEMDGTTGVNRFTAVTVTNGGSATAIGVRLNNAGTVLFPNTATNTIATSGAKALDAASTNLSTSRWNDIRVTGSGSGAIRLNNTSGALVLGDGVGTDLSLQTTSGATAALDIASSNSVMVNGGTATISATGGPAVDIRNSNGSLYGFDSVSSTNSTGDGINLDTNVATPFTVITGTISGAAGIAVDVNGGGVGDDVSYGGAINDGSGPLSAEITGRSGGAVTLSGNIADGADLGGGIAVSANSAGSTTFSGASKVLNTGAANAVSMGSNGSVLTGHAVSFTGGGLDIDTTSGHGLSASAGGSLTVTGAGNTIDTGTGSALLIDLTNIGSSNVTFQRTSSNGASVGIRANATGTAGRLVVTGNGGTCTPANTAGCTGGRLANLSGGDNATTTPGGTGIVLNNTLNPSFTRMWIHDASNYGIRGTLVAGFTMAESVINGANGTTALTANKDGSVRFEELTGTVNMTNVSLSGGYFTNLMVDNTAGVLNATLDNVDSLALNATGGDDAVQFEGIGTSDMNVDYRNSQITTATGDLFQYIGDGTGGGDLDFTSNTLTNNEPSIATGGGGVALIAGAKGAATMDVTNNTMRDSLTNALTIIKSRDAAAGTNNLVANITGNTIGAAPANSGSIEGDGMEITTFGDGNATFNVTNNNIRQYNSSGMQFVAGSGVVDGGQFNLNISGNTLANPGTNPSITLLQGIRVDSGVAAGDTFATCVKFGANSITGSSDAANKDFRLVASQSTTIRQPGYAGGATDGVAFAAFAASLIGGGAQGTAAANAPATFSGTGTTCP